MASEHIRNHYYNKNTRKTTYESFTSSKSNFNEMHIFGMTYVQIKTKLDSPCEKASLSAMINKLQLTIHFLELMAIKRIIAPLYP